jgi:hypothetical protein
MHVHSVPALARTGGFVSGFQAALRCPCPAWWPWCRKGWLQLSRINKGTYVVISEISLPNKLEKKFAICNPKYRNLRWKIITFSYSVAVFLNFWKTWIAKNSNRFYRIFNRLTSIAVFPSAEDLGRIRANIMLCNPFPPIPFNLSCSRINLVSIFRNIMIEE